jgi:hypothetical protein
MASEYHHFQDEGVLYDDWECVTCDKMVSVTGAATLYQDVCTCAGSFAQGHNHPQQGEALDQQEYPYRPQITANYAALQSYASSLSARCPEEPERDVPNTTATNGHAPGIVNPGPDDLQCQLSSSDPSGLTLQMRRFLLDQSQSQRRLCNATEPASPDPRDLVENFHVRPKKRGSSIKKRKASHQSVFSSSDEEYSMPGNDPNIIRGVGGWVGEKGSCPDSTHEYPQTMSGISDYPHEG